MTQLITEYAPSALAFVITVGGWVFMAGKYSQLFKELQHRLDRIELSGTSTAQRTADRVEVHQREIDALKASQRTISDTVAKIDARTERVAENVADIKTDFRELREFIRVEKKGHES